MRPQRYRTVIALSVLMLILLCGCSDKPTSSRVVLQPTTGPGGAPLESVSPAASRDLATGAAVVGGSDEEYEASLGRRREELRSRLQAIPPDSAKEQRRRLEKELELVQEKFEDSTRAYVEQQKREQMAAAAAELFLQKAESESWWEMDYALRSGELSLARAIIQDHLARLERRTERAKLPSLPNEQRVSAPGVEMRELRRLAGQAFLRLAGLAASGADFEEALRNYRFAIDYSGDLAVSADAMGGYAELLRTLERDEEAQEADRRRQELLLRATP